MIAEEEFRTSAGPEWERIREILDGHTIDFSPTKATSSSG